MKIGAQRKAIKAVILVAYKDCTGYDFPWTGRDGDKVRSLYNKLIKTAGISNRGEDAVTAVRIISLFIRDNAEQWIKWKSASAYNFIGYVMSEQRMQDWLRAIEAEEGVEEEQTEEEALSEWGF